MGNWGRGLWGQSWQWKHIQTYSMRRKFACHKCDILHAAYLCHSDRIPPSWKNGEWERFIAGSRTNYTSLCNDTLSKKVNFQQIMPVSTARRGAEQSKHKHAWVCIATRAPLNHLLMRSRGCYRRFQVMAPSSVLVPSDKNCSKIQLLQAVFPSQAFRIRLHSMWSFPALITAAQTQHSHYHPPSKINEAF